MNVGLYDVDSHNFPNLALMKLSAWHKLNGDKVCLINNSPLQSKYDLVYKAKVFTKYVPEVPIRATEVISGGTGYGLDNRLPEKVECIYPDYDLYNCVDTAYGFLTRGCFCIVSRKEGSKSQKVADLDSFWRGQKNIVLLDPNILACPDREGLFQQLIDSKALVDFTQGLDIRLVSDTILELLSQIRIERVHFSWDLQDSTIEEKLKWFANNYPKRFARDLFTVYVLVNYNTSFDYEVKKVKKVYRLLSKFVNQPITFYSYANFSSYIESKFG